MARPSLLTPKVQRTICAALRDGHSFEGACGFAGIAPSTAYEWCARVEGRDPRRRAGARYRQFAEAVARTQGAVWRDEIRAEFAGLSERSKDGQAAMEREGAGFPEFSESEEGFAESEHDGALRSTSATRTRSRFQRTPANPSETSSLRSRSFPTHAIAHVGAVIGHPFQDDTTFRRVVGPASRTPGRRSDAPWPRLRFLRSGPEDRVEVQRGGQNGEQIGDPRKAAIRNRAIPVPREQSESRARRAGRTAYDAPLFPWLQAREEACPQAVTVL
jgi:hypothetical protein